MPQGEWYKRANWELKVPLDKPDFSQTTGKITLNGFSFYLTILITEDDFKYRKKINLRTTHEESVRIPLPKVILNCNPILQRNPWSVCVQWKARLLHVSHSGNSVVYTEYSNSVTKFNGDDTQRELGPPSSLNVPSHPWIQTEKSCLLVVTVCLMQPLTKPDLDLAPMTFSAPWNHSDVVFAVEEKEIHAHRPILSLHSPVFSTMLYGDFKEKESATIELPGKRHEDFIELLHLLYPQFEAFKLDFEKALRLVGLFHEYQIAKLEDMARQVLLDGINTANAFTFYYLANQYEYEELKHKALRTLSQQSTEYLLRQQPYIDADAEFRTLIREARVLYLEKE